MDTAIRREASPGEVTRIREICEKVLTLLDAEHCDTGMLQCVLLACYTATTCAMGLSLADIQEHLLQETEDHWRQYAQAGKA